MKNVLFATTALIATAGFASAEVSLSGSAEMGIIGGDQGVSHVAGQNNDTSNADQFYNSIDITFTLSGESDNGITFGATIDLDESQDSNGNFSATDGGPDSVFISGDFGTLTMGDTDGALDKAVQETDIIGDISDASTTYSVNSMGFMDGRLDGQVARYDYSIAGFGLSLSAETDDTGVNQTAWGFGATYALGGVKLGAGYQGGESRTGVNAEAWGVSADYTVGDFRVVANYDDFITNVKYAKDLVSTQYGIAAVYTMDALSLGANYGEIHAEMAGGNYSTEKAFGLAANYDLGGGLVLKAGYGEQMTEYMRDPGVGTSTKAKSLYSLGLAMSF